MYRPINGYTKAKIIETIQTRMQDHPAGDGIHGCQYKTKDGNRCAIGIFIPDHEVDAQEFKGGVRDLLKNYTHLHKQMPLQIKALLTLQNIHDTNTGLDNSDRRPKLIAWVKKNVS